MTLHYAKSDFTSYDCEDNIFKRLDLRERGTMEVAKLPLITFQCIKYPKACTVQGCLRWLWGAVCNHTFDFWENLQKSSRIEFLNLKKQCNFSNIMVLETIRYVTCIKTSQSFPKPRYSNSKIILCIVEHFSSPFLEMVSQTQTFGVDAQLSPMAGYKSY
jgi:hypothetical protein